MGRVGSIQNFWLNFIFFALTLSSYNLNAGLNTWPSYFSTPRGGALAQRLINYPTRSSPLMTLNRQQKQNLQYVNNLTSTSLLQSLPQPPAHSPWLKALWLEKRLKQQLSPLTRARLLYQGHTFKPYDKELLQSAFEAFQQARHYLDHPSYANRGRQLTVFKTPSSTDMGGAGPVVRADKKNLKWQASDTRKMQQLKKLLRRKNKAHFVLQKAPHHFTLSDQFTVARYFTKKRQFKKARAFYTKVIDSSKTPLHLKVKAYRKLAHTHKLEQNRAAALKEFLNLKYFLTSYIDGRFDIQNKVNWSSRRWNDYFYTHKFYVNGLISLVYAYWSVEKVPEAQALIDKMMALAQKHTGLENHCCLRVQKTTYKKYVKAGKTRRRKITKWQNKKISLNYLNQHFKLASLHRLRGQIAMQQGQVATALKSFNQALSYKIKKPVRQQLLWDVAWAYKKQNHLVQAIQTVQQLRRQVDRYDPLKRKYIFWQAYWHQQLGQLDKAHDLFEQLLSEKVLSYYAVLAYEQLHQQGRRVAWPWPGVGRYDELGVRPEGLAGLGPPYGSGVKGMPLYRGGLLQLASSIDQRLPLLRPLRRGGYGQALGLYVQQNAKKLKKRDRVLAYSYAGQHQQALRAWANLGPRAKVQVVTQNLGALFPKAYALQVQQATDRFQVPSALVYAIMRQESDFNPRTRCPLDAFGLMQMLPQVAAQDSRQLLFLEQKTLNAAQKSSRFKSQHKLENLDLHYTGAQDLYHPRTSILLGAFHLAELLRQQGAPVFAIASYNAGAHRVDKWKTFSTGPYLDFIEDIPYTETRRYTKLVLRNMAVYNYLSQVQVGVGLRALSSPLGVEALSGFERFKSRWFLKPPLAQTGFLLPQLDQKPQPVRVLSRFSLLPDLF